MAGEAHGAGADPVQVRDAIQSRRTLIVAVSRPTGFTLAQFSGRGRARCVSSLLDVSRPAGDIAPGPGAAAAGFDGPLDAASPRSQWKAKSRCFSRSNNVSRPGVSPKSRSQSHHYEPVLFDLGPWTRRNVSRPTDFSPRSFSDTSRQCCPEAKARVVGPLLALPLISMHGVPSRRDHFFAVPSRRVHFSRSRRDHLSHRSRQVARCPRHLSRAPGHQCLVAGCRGSFPPLSENGSPSPPGIQFSSPPGLDSHRTDFRPSSRRARQPPHEIKGPTIGNAIHRRARRRSLSAQHDGYPQPAAKTARCQPQVSTAV
jgi:hypothetical protein